MRAVLPRLQHTEFPELRRARLDALQVNLGYRCNQSCLHCHVNAGPERREMMDRETLDCVLRVLQARAIGLLDLTGGAPELHEGFRTLVSGARALGVRVIDRCNLTVLFEPGQEGLALFLAANEVEVVASLPCYLAENVDQQRGAGVFARSIEALRLLNSLGYGREGSGLILNLAYNPLGPSLPPDQPTLRSAYKNRLLERHDVFFNDLFVIANMPIQRFGSALISSGQFDDYMRLLQSNFSAANIDKVMCRSLVSVDWQGHLYDCDFNQQLGLALLGDGRPQLRDLLQGDLQGNPIRVAGHCHACTAGQGSSCGGALHG